jgi:intermediate peptidase
VRRQVYLAGHSSPKANVRILDELIATRHEVAQLLGFNSYADFFLRPLMARTPDAVVTFLETLSAQLKGPAEKVNYSSLPHFSRRVLA